MMTTTEAKRFRIDHDTAARMLNRMSKAQLKTVFIRNMQERGMEMLYGGPVSKDELISAILAFEYPIAMLNEAIHVLYHDSAQCPNEVCDYCRAEVAMLDPTAQPPF